MKRIICFILVFAFVMSAGGCGRATPLDKAIKFVAENGEKTDEGYIYEFEEGYDKIRTGIKGLYGNDDERVQKCSILCAGDDFAITIEDREISPEGNLLRERGVKLGLNGDIYYKDAAIMDGIDFGGWIKADIDVKKYRAEAYPRVLDHEFLSGSGVNENIKNYLRSYVNIAIECLEDFADKKIESTIYDLGFESYRSEDETEN